MDPFDELWLAAENVNPTYHDEQWPKCPECGDQTLTFYENGKEDEKWLPVPKLIYCSCGWARVPKNIGQKNSTGSSTG